MSEPEVNFAVVRAAKLRRVEFARFLRVSPAAVTWWFQGKRKVGPQLAQKVQRIVRALESAVAANELPLPKMPKAERELRLVAALVKHMKQS